MQPVAQIRRNDPSPGQTVSGAAVAIGKAAADYASTVQGLQELGGTFDPMDGPQELMLVNNGAGSINVYAEYPQPFSAPARAEHDGG